MQLAKTKSYNKFKTHQSIV